MVECGRVARVVIDTNAALDLLLFEDPRCAALAAALRGGRVCAVTRADCVAEWHRVLAYPAFDLDAARRSALADAYGRLFECLPGAAAHDVAPLPRCRDPDDQKFLELARDSGAITLISRDNELLRLSRRTERAAGFRIVPPEHWTI